MREAQLAVLAGAGREQHSTGCVAAAPVTFCCAALPTPRMPACLPVSCPAPCPAPAPAAEFSTRFAGQVKELDCEGYVLKKWERRIDGVMKYMQVQAWLAGEPGCAMPAYRGRMLQGCVQRQQSPRELPLHSTHNALPLRLRPVLPCAAARWRARPRWATRGWPGRGPSSKSSTGSAAAS